MRNTFHLAAGLALIVAVLAFSFSPAQLMAAEKLDVQYLAVHFGNADNAAVLDRAAFPGFVFYSADGPAMGYAEEQKMMGNPRYLHGWYGLVPETMGFSANYSADPKQFSHESGLAVVVDSEGVIAYKTPASRISAEFYPDVYDKAMDDIKSTLKKLAKGKTVKPLKESRRAYLKKSPMGELEPTKKAELDKKDEGLVGWPMPSLKVRDGSGAEHDLPALLRGRVSVVVFYSLNGATWINGDKNGEVAATWQGAPLMNPASVAEAGKKEFEAEDGAKTAMKSIGFGMLKAAAGVGDSPSANAFSAMAHKKELTESEKLGAYANATELLTLVGYTMK